MVVMFTDHAKKRLRQRGIDGKFVHIQMQGVPRCDKATKWLFRSGLFVVFVDDVNGNRLIITAGWYLKGKRRAEKKRANAGIRSIGKFKR